MSSAQLNTFSLIDKKDKDRINFSDIFKKME